MVSFAARTTGAVYSAHVPLAPTLYSFTAASAGKLIVTATSVLVGAVISADKVASAGGCTFRIVTYVNGILKEAPPAIS
ncbi:hypothetical protein D3C85_1585560 [compost metagenome]